MKMPEKQESQKNPIVFLDIKIDKLEVGRIIIELRNDVCPKTCENFRALCTGEKGLSYKGSKFHKVIKLCLAQGGDIIKHTGSSGMSIYGQYFEDENFILKHEPGSVSMANFGKPDSNNSQFFITTVDCSHLDGTNVVFGRVIKGLSAITTEMETYTTDEGVPTREITIIDCGEIKDGEPLGICDDDGTSDLLPSYPYDWEKFNDKVSIEEMLKVLNDIKESGNYFYRAGNILKSAQKYKKCTRYYNHFKNVTTNKIEVKQLDEIQLVNLTNLAATELKIESYDDVLSTCNEAIKLHDKNFKAFYRRGIANVIVKNFENAVEDFEVALKLQPENREIQKRLDQAKKVLKSYRDVEKVKYQKMFN